jgi:hypothetical protein
MERETLGDQKRMITQTWTYQPKNTKEKIGKLKKMQVRKAYIGNT